MYRFFLTNPQPEIKTGGTLILEPQLFHRIKNVLRIKPHETIIFLYKNEEIEAKFVNDITKIISHKYFNLERKYKFILIQALPSNKTWIRILKTATELDVTEIIGWHSKYSNFPKNKFNHKITRFEEVINEACQQTARKDKPTIKYITNLNELHLHHGLNLVFYEKTLINKQDWKNVKFKLQETENINLFIGPEGGFAKEEIDFLKQQPNLYFLSLGTNTLRVETAVNSAITLVQFLKNVF